MNPAIAREYRKLRQPHVGIRYRHIAVAPAQGALELARKRVWFNEHFTSNGDSAYVNDAGTWRVRILPDEYQSMEDMEGDTFNVALNKDTVPGGARTIEAERKEYESKLENNGVWGYVLEKKCDKCGNWEHVDSCWGFDDAEYLLSMEVPSITYSYAGGAA